MYMTDVLSQSIFIALVHLRELRKNCALYFCNFIVLYEELKQFVLCTFTISLFCVHDYVLSHSIIAHIGVPPKAETCC